MDRKPFIQTNLDFAFELKFMDVSDGLGYDESTSSSEGRTIMAKQISQIRIQASARKVWDALTDPALVKQWQFGSDLLTDWREGSEIRFRNEWEGNVYEQWGSVMEVVQDRLIKYSLFAPRPGLEDKPENYFIMSYILQEAEEGILLSIQQEDNRPGADSRQEHQDGESSVLSALKSVAEAL